MPPTAQEQNWHSVAHSTAHPGILSRVLSGHMLSFRMLVEHTVCLPLVTNARVNLWSPAGRRNGLQSATTNKFLIADPTICPGFHMARRGAGFCRARFREHQTSIYCSGQRLYLDCSCASPDTWLTSSTVEWLVGTNRKEPEKKKSFSKLYC